MKELQALVAKAVADRGYRQGWTDEQYAARQICKAVEELGELRDNVWFKDLPEWAMLISRAGLAARADFDRTGTWREVRGEKEDIAKELADVLIPLLVLAETLDIDLEQAIREKVLGDVSRGVRGKKPEEEEQWIPLCDLRAGAVFEMRDGTKAIKCAPTAIERNMAKIRCVLLEDGEYFYLGATRVREIALPRGQKSASKTQEQWTPFPKNE